MVFICKVFNSYYSKHQFVQDLYNKKHHKDYGREVKDRFVGYSYILLSISGRIYFWRTPFQVNVTDCLAGNSKKCQNFNDDADNET